MLRRAALLAGLFTIVALPVLAQIPMENIRGKVKSLDGDKLTVATREGKTAIVTLTKTWGVAVMKPVDLEAIKPGSFIGTTEIEKPGGGGGESLEVHVFPPGVKIGEGHYPWDLKPRRQHDQRHRSYGGERWQGSRAGCGISHRRAPHHRRPDRARGDDRWRLPRDDQAGGIAVHPPP